MLQRLIRAQSDPRILGCLPLVHLLDYQVCGIHFYTLNKSDATRQIYQSLGLPDSTKLRRARGQLAAVDELPSGMAEVFTASAGRAVGPMASNLRRPVATCLPSVSRWLQTAIWEVSSAL